MRTAWLRWWELTTRERLILLQALALLPVAGILLHFFRYQTLYAKLQRLTPLRAQGPMPIDLDQARRLGQLVNIAAWRGLYDATCLRRSLLLWWMLRRRGIDSTLRIGVRMEDGEFMSHAWVEWQDTVLNDAPDVGQRFMTML
jgi:hypothetical protein